MKKLRKKDPASSQHQLCYTGEELLQYQSEKLPPEQRSRIFHHLNVEKCERCRRLYLSVKEPDKETITPGFAPSIIEKIKKRKIAHRTCPVPMRLEKGQIWTTSPKPKNIYGEIVGSAAMGVPVMIIFPGSGEKSLKNIIRIIPVSCDIEFQLEGESLVIDKTSPLQYPILLEIFNEKPMFAGNLEEYRGSISSEDLMKVIALRKQFMDGETSKPDTKYLAWKQKEIEITDYLTFPVNEGIWEDAPDSAEKLWEDLPATIAHIADEVEPVIIRLEEYRKAADTTGIRLFEIRPHVLMETDDVSILIVQAKDKVLLRFTSAVSKPETLRIDGESLTMPQTNPGLYEVLLGYVNQMPESMKIMITVGKETFQFYPEFIKGSTNNET
jgi:hypothetical protein